MTLEDYSCDPIWTLDPAAAPYDPAREQAYMYWVPNSEDLFYLLHYSPGAGAVAYRIGPTYLDVFALDADEVLARRSFSGPYRGPGPAGGMSGPGAVAAVVHEVWWAIREGKFDERAFSRLMRHPAVKELVDETKARPHDVVRLPAGLRGFCGVP